MTKLNTTDRGVRTLLPQVRKPLTQACGNSVLTPLSVVFNFTTFDRQSDIYLFTLRSPGRSWCSTRVQSVRISSVMSVYWKKVVWAYRSSIWSLLLYCIDTGSFFKNIREVNCDRKRRYPPGSHIEFSITWVIKLIKKTCSGCYSCTSQTTQYMYIHDTSHMYIILVLISSWNS